MANGLPQLDSNVFLTDSGLETTLLFDEGFDLPLFASFPLLDTGAGVAVLDRYYATHAAIARELGVGAVLDTPTWRSSDGWGAQLGYSASAIRDINRRAIDLLVEVRARFQTAASPIVINGAIGPSGDGYRPTSTLTVEQAHAYHRPQVAALAEHGADLVTAVTMTYVEEAIGLTRAAMSVGVPIAVSFTVETDGRLPSGMSLGDAVTYVDSRTDGAVSYFLINCAHPTHFAHVLDTNDDWVRRLRGVRTNGSRLSHAELDEATELSAEEPAELAAQITALRVQNPQLTILGGCCGTNHRHIAAIGAACTHGG